VLKGRGLEWMALGLGGERSTGSSVRVQSTQYRDFTGAFGWWDGRCFAVMRCARLGLIEFRLVALLESVSCRRLRDLAADGELWWLS
jgi:hypothetical protein